MSETIAPVFRLPCPHCQRVLKIPADWAGRKGACPACGESVEFPRTLASNIATSKLGEQIMKMLSESDESIEEKNSDHISMLLSQGTCRDYQLVKEALGDLRPSARQWRRMLSSAAVRESMRQHIESQLDRLPEIPEDEVPSLAVAEAPAHQDAWRILARYAYFLSHGTCKACKENPTGLHCLYLSYDHFAKLRSIAKDRSDRWQTVCQHLLGL